ncbi:hypothetical protein PENSPDRAFT_682046 [Peniophora sp. CONT]|nr:hypothetical protein PENSPDRAFT_682046 [Peniophora sp. CONT]
MSKRALSPALLPPSKRIHVPANDKHHVSAPERTFDSLFFDELILNIFSYLSYSDLCAVQGVNHNWARLSLDNQLWKSLYVNEYGRLRLRGGRGSAKRPDGREIRPLPGRAAQFLALEGLKDWKWMFKISRNWRTGHCSVTSLRAQESSESLNTPSTSRTTDDLVGTTPVTLTSLVLSGLTTICASSEPSLTPSIQLLGRTTHPILCQAAPKSADAPMHVTALTVDQSHSHTGHTRFAVCLSNGELAVHDLKDGSLVPTIQHHYAPPVPISRVKPIIQAAYHHPLLVTLSESFSLSVYDATTPQLRLVHCLTSFMSYPPASLVLTAPSPTSYKLLVSYCCPTYPRHWSIGMTEVLIRSTTSSAAFEVQSTRSIRALDMPVGFIDDARMEALREQWGRKVPAVAATQSDGKWVVMAPTDAPCTECALAAASFSVSCPHPDRRAWAPTSLPLQLYRLSFPSSGASSGANSKLSFVRHLYGQSAPIASLALADGRCVGLGLDGSVWTWDLEGGGLGVEVSPPTEGYEIDEEEGARRARLRDGMKGVVSFDERRIVTSGPGGVVVRNFDT